MWTYIIKWCIISVTLGGPTGHFDEFGRYQFNTDLVARYNTEKSCDHQKEFYTKESAFYFYNKALSESIEDYLWLGQGDFISNVTICRRIWSWCRYNVCSCSFGGASSLSVKAGLDSFYWFIMECSGKDIRKFNFTPVHNFLQVRHAYDTIF